MPLLFLNGDGMRGGRLHRQLRGAPLVREARTAPKYRFWSVGGRFPALEPVADGGRAVHGELYDVGLPVLRDLLRAEPAELELGVIELDDGTASLGMVLRRPFDGAQGLEDISAVGDWRVYHANRR
jgi:gamma-glutamylcyclotransferase (GGCT)/AIG2-like uncharacterized protein YtfP